MKLWNKVFKGSANSNSTVTNWVCFMYEGKYVDFYRLIDGIYEADKPQLFPEGSTKMGLAVKFQSDVSDVLGEIPQNIIKRFGNNLKQCQLVNIEVTIKEQG